jgi:Mrp family chromosome partitioning ATPase
VDLTTIKGIAKARWWVLLGAAILAVVLSGRLAEYRNDNLPEYEAASVVTFVEDLAAADRDEFESFLDAQLALAQNVNSDVLTETPGPFLPWLMAEVELDTSLNQLVFIGRGFTQEEANAMTETMRDRFLSTSEIGAGQERLSAELDEVTQQIIELRQEISASQAAIPLTEEQLATQAQRSAIEAQIASLQASYGALTVELMNPILRSADEIQAEMERVYGQLVALQTQLAGIPLPPTPEELAADNEELLLDQLRLDQLQARWQQLYAGQRDLAARASDSAAIAQPVTLDAASPLNNQALAAVGAVFAALIGLIAIERGRGIMWAESDLEEGPPVLVELPSRPLAVFHHPTSEPWYLDAPGGRRKAAIQMMRTQLDDHQHAVVAFQGTGVYREDISELTADVGVAIAVSGRSVLLIDASFRERNDLVEFGTDHGATLSSLLTDASSDREQTVIDFKTALLASPEVVHGLRTLRAGRGEWDEADAMAGYGFEVLLEVARELFDLVLIAGSDSSEAASHVLAQRVDSVILVTSAGHTVTRSVEATDRDFTIRRATMLGVVLLRRRRNKVTAWLGNGARTGLWKAIDGFQAWRHRTFDRSDEPGEPHGLHETQGVDGPDESDV